MASLLRHYPRLLPLRRKLLVIVLVLSVSGQASAETTSRPANTALTEDFSAPSRVVDELHHKLVDVMQRAGELGYQGRYRELEPLISSRFDTPLIVKVILSRHWGNLDDTDKSEFTKLFNRLSIATYASRFNGYDGEDFLEISREPVKRGRLLIKTELRRPAGETISLDYLMHEKDGKWYIISVIANGVNDLSLKRAEYASVIKEKGYNGLIENISGKIRHLENQAGAD